jgi:hypothetical protein
MQLDDFLDFLEHRIKSRVAPETLEDAILSAILDTRDKSELDATTSNCPKCGRPAATEDCERDDCGVMQSEYRQR